MRVRVDRTLAVCQRCGQLSETRVELTYELGGLLAADRWTCVECSVVLHQWRCDSTAPIYNYKKKRRGEQLSLF